jgi:hypothetical protein
MTGGPTVSVVIPTYNRAALLRATLDAILAQTCPPLEVIVVDDGSTDATPAVLAGYAPRVRAIVQDNAGDLVARNTGLRAAGGELVAFCDSDDLWRPDFLAGMLALWTAAPATRVAFSDFVLVRDDRWATAGKFGAAPAGFWDGRRMVGEAIGVFDAPIVERLLRFQPFFPSCLVARRAFFLELGGWDEGVSRVIGCDFATALLLAEHTPFGVVDRPLVGIRKHAGNISADVQAMNLGDATVLEHVLATRPSLAPHAPAIRASIAGRRADALATAFARHDFAAVRAIYRQLPPERRAGGVAIKHIVACLPVPLREAAARALLGLGSLGATRNG